MEVKLAVLADYANVTKEGKLNLLGLFNVLNVPNLPWTHPQMQLVLVFESGPAEWDTVKKVEVKLFDEDAHEKFAMGADLRVPRGQSGKKVSINSIIFLNNLSFDVAGDYSFCVLVGGETKMEIPLAVNVVPRRDEGPG
ncbi:DUF6941 family protein [Chloroflexota bacterium]